MAKLKQGVWTFDRSLIICKCLINWVFSKQTGWPVRFGVIKIIRRLISSIKSFNTEVTTKPRKCGRYLVWLTEASYANKIFMR